MNSDDDKPTQVLGDLEGIRDLLDKSLVDKDGIPTLEQSIPELNEKIEINDNFKVSLDADNSTETVEQQLARTHHEEASASLELIPELTEELSITNDAVEEEPDFTFKLVETPDEPSKQVSQIENITDNNQYDLDSVDFNIQDQLQNPQTHQHVRIQNEELKVETIEQQQQDIEQIAEQEFENIQNEVSIETNEDIQTESFDDVEMADLILKNAWIKVEMLLMDNLPPQLSGAFLELLNSRVDENKLQLFEELALLDKDTFSELLEAVKIDQGF